MISAAERRWFSGEYDEAELIFAELLSLPIPLESKMAKRDGDAETK